MKNTISYARPLVAAWVTLAMPIFNSFGQEPTTPAPGTAAGQTPVVTQPAVVAAPVANSTPAVVKLPYGVDDVLKLARSNISEDIILNYIQNSGTIYNLGPQDIVYLRNQGVSDRVVSAMLNQRKQVEAAAAAQSNVQTPQAVSYAPVVPYAAAVPEAASAPVAPVYEDSGQAVPAAASSVYVIPYPQATAAYYGYYGYPYGYYGSYYYGPSVSIGFGFGSSCYGHGYYHGYSHAYYGHAHGHGGHH